MKNFYFILTLFFLATCSLWGQTTGTPPSSVNWMREVRFRFQDIPLGEALTSQSKASDFSFFLDRRVDSEIPITYSADTIPLAQAMTEMIEGVGLEAVRLGPILYVGPAKSGGELLLTLALHRQTRGEISDDTRNGLAKRFVFPKDDFLEPSVLLKSASKKAGLSWTGLDKMPFDYWRMNPLPPMATGEMISLILIGFDVDYRADAKKTILKPVAFQKEGTVTRSWPAEEVADLNRDDFPGIKWTEIRQEIRGTGSFRDIAQIEYLASKQRMKNLLAEIPDQRNQDDATPSEPSKPNRGGNVISGEIKQATLQFVFEELNSQLNLEVVLDPSLDKRGITLETRISCRFNNANSKRALKTIADELGVSYRLNGKRAIFYNK